MQQSKSRSHVSVDLPIAKIDNLKCTIDCKIGSKVSYDGTLNIIFGPMGSSKTTTLLLALKRYQQQKKQVVAIKYTGDNRYISETISSHDGLHLKGIKILACTNLSKIEVAPYEVIGIDEGQFFTNIKSTVLSWLFHGKHIIIAALDSTVEREIFNLKLMELIPWATNVTKLTAICNVCGEVASFTQRKSEFIKDYVLDREAPSSSLSSISSNPINIPLFEATKVGGFDQYAVYCLKCLNTYS